MAGSVNLGDQLDGVVDKLVKAGRYGSRSEVLREGIRLVQEREAKLARFEAEIQRGIDDIAAGRTKPADEVFDRLRRKYEAMAAKSAA
ncbi:type II toxin-antitoxin system ParD family antitoxin [Sphingomonas sp. So64.6b]|uniref:type II toxin-antitoxin system ParD family antitoxin n=1 Tax=Sphingomonas sp. So64.6b TaxID=2997354 RepID=UPI001604233C|nr:type II toxin-antitoxin system ParD family antitoxin [Sphingomonas sp. So64.6b]QNA83081.1 type II toxin-antitoxin system ParD family antitoxin [Sphingomonas sp. So64.6b]